MSLTTDSAESSINETVEGDAPRVPADGGRMAAGEAALELHRNGRFAAVLGLMASATAIAWLTRAGAGGNWVDWLVCAVTATIGINQLLVLADARTPLLAADEHGIRVRLAREWLGLPWSTLEQVVVEEREGPVRDGRLVLVPRNLDEVLGAVLPSSRRTVAWQRRLHGAPLTVPLNLATRAAGGDVGPALRRLSAGRTEIVIVRGRDRATLTAPDRPGRTRPPVAHERAAGGDGVVTDERTVSDERIASDERFVPDARPRLARLMARLAGAPTTAGESSASHEQADGALPTAEPDAPEAPPVAVPAPVASLRAARTAVRSDVVRPVRPRPLPAEPLDAADLPRVDHVEERVLGAVVIGEDQPVAVAEPVIGPQIREARMRAGLDLEELSDRTRIRPHVLEGIEVDDFSPCGGDFYARGHLRTLARYLGLDGESLVSAYDARYSHAPVNARRVFEAELATGISGGMRATSGGPRWSLIAAAVLALVMVWSAARFLTDQPTTLSDPVVSDSAGLAANHEPITSPLTDARPLAVKAVGGRTHVVVRDRTGAVLWSGVLHRGESHAMAGVAPFIVHASNAAATRVQFGKRWVGPVGSTTTPASRSVG